MTEKSLDDAITKLAATSKAASTQAQEETQRQLRNMEERRSSVASLRLAADRIRLMGIAIFDDVATKLAGLGIVAGPVKDLPASMDDTELKERLHVLCSIGFPTPKGRGRTAVVLAVTVPPEASGHVSPTAPGKVYVYEGPLVPNQATLNVSDSFDPRATQMTEEGLSKMIATALSKTMSPR